MANENLPLMIYCEKGIPFWGQPTPFLGVTIGEMTPMCRTVGTRHQNRLDPGVYYHSSCGPLYLALFRASRQPAVVLMSCPGVGCGKVVMCCVMCRLRPCGPSAWFLLSGRRKRLLTILSVSLGFCDKLYCFTIQNSSVRMSGKGNYAI